MFAALFSTSAFYPLKQRKGFWCVWLVEFVPAALLSYCVTPSGSLVTVGKTDRFTDLWQTSSETKGGWEGWVVSYQIKEKPLSFFPQN